MAKLSTTNVFGDLLVDGMIHGNVTGNLTGNASTATSATTASKADILTTARNIALGGVLSGSASFNGSANITISASVAKPPKSGDWFSGGMPIVSTDGVMEIGKYIDFHNTDASTNNYDVRLQANTSTPCVINLPSGGGTLARTSDSITGNAATATKLATARTIQIGNKSNTFDGSANITYTLSDIGAAPTSHGQHAVYGTCETAAATAEKAITISGSGFSLAAGQMIAVKFTNSNTASNVKFNVNSTGAKPIWYNNAEYTGNSNRVTGYANAVMTYVYNGSHWVWVSSGVDNNTTYSNVALGHGYATCDTAESTAAKVGTLSSYALTKGGIVAVKFSYAVPASATLNINSKGAKSIYFRNAAITANIIKAGDTATFIYDGTYYQLLSIDRWQNDITSHTHNYAGSSSAGGAANSAVKWSTARTLTIGSTGKSVDGSGNISWTLSEIGAAATSHNHNTFTALTGSSWTTATRDIQTDCVFEFSSHITKSATGLFPVDSNANAMISFNRHSGPYASQLGFSSNGKIYYRFGNGTAITDSTAWQQIYTSTNKPSLTDLGAAASSHGTHVTYSSTAPKVAGTASAGSESAVARGDHVHAAQTSVSGNAGTATKLQSAKSITIGNKSNNFDGSANITYTLAQIGAFPAAGGTITGATTVQTTSTAPFAIQRSANTDEKVSMYVDDAVFTMHYLNDETASSMKFVLENTDEESGGGAGKNTAQVTFTGSGGKSTVAADNFTEGGTALSSKYAKASHGTHVTYSTSTPLVAGTASVGSANNVSRGDHVHPAQTSVSGNAGTATKLQTARNINGTSFDGSANITTANWGTSRTITIGKTGKSVNGSGNVSWTMNEIMGAVSLSSSGTANKNKYIKFATVTLTNTWQCCSGKLALTNTEATASYGILHFYLRNGSAITTTSIELGWLTLNNSNYANRVYAVKVSDGKYDLYYRPYTDYETTRFTLLECNDPAVITLSAGSYTDSITAAATSSMKGIAAAALKLTTARNIKIGNKSNSFDGSGNIEFTLADIGIGSSISAVASNLSGVTINGYDSMMTTINSNLGNL